MYFPAAKPGQAALWSDSPAVGSRPVAHPLICPGGARSIRAVWRHGLISSVELKGDCRRLSFDYHDAEASLVGGGFLLFSI